MGEYSRVNFTCPHCASRTGIEEVTEVTMSSVIKEIAPEGIIEYGQMTNDVVERYQCIECGWRVPIWCSEKELFEWLDARGMLEPAEEEDEEAEEEDEEKEKPREEIITDVDTDS